MTNNTPIYIILVVFFLLLLSTITGLLIQGYYLYYKGSGLTSVPISNTGLPDIATNNIYDNIWLAEHNRVRSDIGLNPVTWNTDLAIGAEEYSKQCKFEHSSQNNRLYNGIMLGENLAYGTPYNQFTDKTMFKLWEDEKELYKYPQTVEEAVNNSAGHYSQIVNKGLTEIGCGCSNCNGDKLCVCRYKPIQISTDIPY